MILSWFENRPPDEIPKEHLWEDPKGLDAWWELVKERKGYEKDRGGSVDMEKDFITNDLAEQLKE